ncbi:MAG: hypothetical protein HQL73_14270 [Magnetococcales bacterium]|nr:hypothetical protein [Magnetococcales bacterium]
MTLNEDHLKRIMEKYLTHDHNSRTHLGLQKDYPDHQPISQRTQVK